MCLHGEQRQFAPMQTVVAHSEASRYVFLFTVLQDRSCLSSSPYRLAFLTVEVSHSVTHAGENKQAHPHLVCYNWALTVYWEVQGFASKNNFLFTKKIQLKQTSALPKAHSLAGSGSTGLGQGRLRGRAALVRQKHTTERLLKLGEVAETSSTPT